jgi:flagellar basal body-associated protein FliL
VGNVPPDQIVPSTLATITTPTKAQATEPANAVIDTPPALLLDLTVIIIIIVIAVLLVVTVIIVIAFYKCQFLRKAALPFRDRVHFVPATPPPNGNAPARRFDTDSYKKYSLNPPRVAPYYYNNSPPPTSTGDSQT